MEGKPLTSELKMKIKFISLCLLLLVASAQAQQSIPIWPKGKMPNSKGLIIRDSLSNERLFQVAEPRIQAFFTSVQENKGAAVLIIPGGGYARLAYQVSGYQLAKWFNTMGMHAFVLEHRLPPSPDVKTRPLVPLQDAQRAMRLIKGNAIKWGIDTSKIGVMGSSAGGHLAAVLSTGREDVSAILDEFDKYSYRPAFQILISPVIDMAEFAHKGSRQNLLGPDPSKELLEKYSPHLQVGAATPPAFIVHAFNDKSVSAMNSLLYYKALFEKHIPSTLHVFPQGGHEIALRNNPGSTASWVDLCEKWLFEMNVLNLPRKD